MNNHSNHKRRSFRPRQQKNGFRRRSNSSGPGQDGHLNNGNNGFTRNGNISNPFNIEKAILRFQQLAKDAQTSGDPVLIENYLQHADHYIRKLGEINLKTQVPSQPIKTNNDNLNNTKVSNTENKPEEKSLAQILTDNSVKEKKN